MDNNLKTWSFGTKEKKLIALVLNGKKTATSSIYDGNIDEVGSKSILIYNNGTKACITKTVKNLVCQFKDVTWDIAKLEGENTTLDEWRKEHYEYFKAVDPNFTNDTMVLVEIFEVIKNLNINK